MMILVTSIFIDDLRLQVQKNTGLLFTLLLPEPMDNSFDVNSNRFLAHNNSCHLLPAFLHTL
jgi:hypothetical protein